MLVFIFGEFVCVHVCVCDNPQKCHVVPFFKVILTYDCSYTVLQKRKNFVEEQGHVSTIVLENTNFGPNYLNVIPTKKIFHFPR